MRTDNCNWYSVTDKFEFSKLITMRNPREDYHPLLAYCANNINIISTKILSDFKYISRFLMFIRSLGLVSYCLRINKPHVIQKN